LATRLICSPCVQPANLKGPVPTGFWKKASSFAAAVWGSIPSIVRWAGSDPNARFVVTMTVESPSFRTSSMSWYTNALISFVLSRARLRE
jgi:hypothetical protein